jgi:hypothetical protein
MTSSIRITESLVFYIPFVMVLAIVGILAIVVVRLWRARASRTWQRVCMRIGAGMLTLPFILCLLTLLVMSACTSRPRLLVSPDAKHIAEYSYEAAFLGRDLTVITVRKKWSLFPARAYQYSGPSDWPDTQVRWPDNKHLRIDYSRDSEGRSQYCNPQAADILNTVRSLPADVGRTSRLRSGAYV